MRLLPGFWLLRATMAAIALLLLLKTASLVQQAAASVPAANPAADPVAPKATAAAPAAIPVSAPEPSGRACPPAPSPAELSLLGDLKARKTSLDQRAATLAAREQALAVAEKQFSARMAELTSLQKRIEIQEAARQAQASADTEKLVNLYAAMKPSDAATIFNELDRDVLLPVLDAMNARRAAPILAAMKPERARLVTAELAEMRARRDSLVPPTPNPANAPQPAPAAPKQGAGG